MDIESRSTNTTTRTRTNTTNNSLTAIQPSSTTRTWLSSLKYNLQKLRRLTITKAFSPSSFIPEIRLPSSHPGRTRSIPTLNPNPPTKSRTNEHTYLFALDHKTWNPPPPLYGTTNLGNTLTNWSRSRLTNTLNLTHRQCNAALNVLATPSLELNLTQQLNTTQSLIIRSTQLHHQ